MNIGQYIIYPNTRYIGNERVGKEYLVGEVIETWSDYQDSNNIEMPGGFKVKIIFLFHMDIVRKVKGFSNGAVVIETTKDEWRHDIIKDLL